MVGRIPVMEVSPVVDHGRYPAKAVVGEPFTVSALVFREGHATFGVPRAVPDVDANGIVVAGSNPIRLGAVPRITFTPRGTSTAGSLFIVGRGNRVYAVRLLGSTQRVRLSCLSRHDEWEGC